MQTARQKEEFLSCLTSRHDSSSYPRNHGTTRRPSVNWILVPRLRTQFSGANYLFEFIKESGQGRSPTRFMLLPTLTESMT